MDVNGTNKYQISQDWNGTGLLIVRNADPANLALDISGSWLFNGIILVIGKLSISGNPVLNGSIFAERGAEVNKITGNANLTFSTGDRDDAFGLITQAAPAVPISWEEL